MSRIYTRLFNTPVIAILLFLGLSSAVSAQVTYTLSGTLSLASGKDPFKLNGTQVTATAILSPATAPTNPSTTSTSSTGTYGGGTVTLGTTLGTLNCDPTVTVTLTDNVGAADTLGINCSVAGLATLTANVSIPDGNMVTAVPANIPSTSVSTASINIDLSGAITAFNLTGATIMASGAAPPTVTPSLTTWTPTAAAGSTTALTQAITFTTTPNSSYDAVSFTATPSGGSWLTVSPGELNTTSSLTITANPSGLTPAIYNGTVTLSSGAPPISVTLTVSAPPALTGPPSMTFGYTVGGSTPPSQQLNIGTVSGSTTVTASVTSGSSWLSIAPPTSAATPASFTVSVNPTGITTTQNGNIHITAADGATPLDIPVTLNVGSSNLVVSPTSLTFNYTIGGTQPAAQPLSLSGSTTGISFSTSTTVNSPTNGTWLGATPTSGTVSSSSSVSVTINTKNLAPGQYTGIVTVTASGSSGSPFPVSVTLNVTGPTLTVTPPTLSFSYTIGSTAPVAQPINVGGTPAGTPFTVTPATTGGGSWLLVNNSTSAANGTTPGSGTIPFGISVDTSVLTTAGAGTFNGTVTVAASGATSQVVNVSVIVTAPTITVGSSSLNFAYQLGGTAPAAQSVTIGGTQGLAFTANATTSSGGAWLSVTPSGTISNSSTISISINTSVLTTAGPLTGTVTVSATGATSQQIKVNLTVSNSPTISASPSTLSFAYQIGTSAPAAQTVNVGGSSGLNFTVTPATTSGGSWLSVTPTSGTTGSSSVPLTVSLNTSVLTTAGTFTGTITIAASGANTQTVNVSLIVSNLPSLTANPSQLTFNFTNGGTVPPAQSVQIAGGTALAFTATAGAPWLSVSPTSGTTSGTINVSVNTADLLPTTYTGAITITASGVSNSPLTLRVTLVVTGAVPKITLSSAALNFNVTGGSPAAVQTVSVSSNVANPVSIAVAGGNWLSAISSASTTPATVTVVANPFNMAPGTYTGAVIVNAPGASNPQQIIPVQFVVSSPTVITAAPSSLSFAYAIGGSSPASQTINVTSTKQTTISTTVAGASWLSVTGAGSATPASLTVSVNPGSLPMGTYQASITIADASSSLTQPQVVAVTLMIGDQPLVASSPTSLTFTGVAGGPSPSTQYVNVSGSEALLFTATASPSWLSLSAPTGSTPATLVASVNTAGMSPGSFQGSITLASSSAVNGPITIPVTLNVAVPLAVTGGPAVNSVVNAASYDMSGFSPGAIVSIFGSQIGPQTGASFTLNAKGELDSTLGGVSVTVNGAPAIPLFVQDGQINVILPFNIGTSGEGNVQVSYNSLTSSQFNIPLTPADVQIFTANARGTGQGSILNQDFSVNGASNPAAPGSVVAVYGTGGGMVTPPVTAGNVAGDTLSNVALPFSATVNGESAVVLYAGTAPGLVYGVYQFNVQLPSDLPAGPAVIVLQVGDSTSQPNVTVFVK